MQKYQKIKYMIIKKDFIFLQQLQIISIIIKINSFKYHKLLINLLKKYSNNKVILKSGI